MSDRISMIRGLVRTEGVGWVKKEYGLSDETIKRYMRKYGKESSSAKILIFDIENAPIEAFVWNKSIYGAFIRPENLIEDWYMISWSAKWLYDSDMMSMVLKPKEAKERDDKRIVKGLWKLFEEADIIIAHNGIGFDVPMANTRFIKHGFNRPSPYKVIDTLKIARREFSFTHNHLDSLGEFLGLGRKKETKFKLWVDCMAGKKSALQEMQAYNKQDVILLEDVFVALRGWAKSLPNMNLYSEGNVCRACGSPNLRKRGTYSATVNTYDAYVCEDCGNYTRERKAHKTDKTLTGTAC